MLEIQKLILLGFSVTPSSICYKETNCTVFRRHNNFNIFSLVSWEKPAFLSNFKFSGTHGSATAWELLLIIITDSLFRLNYLPYLSRLKIFLICGPNVTLHQFGEFPFPDISWSPTVFC